jgi:hypothetical protein
MLTVILSCISIPAAAVLGCWICFYFMGIWRSIVGAPLYWLLDEFEFAGWVADKFDTEDKFEWIHTIVELIPLAIKTFFILLGMYLWGSIVFQYGSKELHGKGIDLLWAHWIRVFCVCMAPCLIAGLIKEREGEFTLASLAYLPSFFILVLFPSIPKYLTCWAPWLR